MNFMPNFKRPGKKFTPVMSQDFQRIWDEFIAMGG
jgi:hypothetical protein